MELDTLAVGDCLEIMGGMRNDSVDVSFADPPFNLGKKYSSSDDKKSRWDYLVWSEQWIDELVRVTKNAIFIHNIPVWLKEFSLMMDDTGAIFRHWIAWNAPSSPMGKSLQPAHYGILYYSKREDVKFYEIRAPHLRCRECDYLVKDYGGKIGKVHPFGPLLGDVWFDLHRVRHRSKRDDHPCQLPVSLLERIILMSTDEGDVVFDPFVGTGTTAIAAKQLGRKYYGIDVDAGYVRIADKKLTGVRESKCAGAYVSRHKGEIVTIRDKDWRSMKSRFDIPSDSRSLNCRGIASLEDVSV